VYIYEALSVVLSCIILGTAVGIFTAITLTIQFNLFLESAFSFQFPVLLFCVTTGLSLLVAVVGSYWPASEFKDLPIALVLKGGSTD
jgi:ABC-type lipoprotein release transport system permease subunit